MKVSFITTVYNEGATVKALLQSLFAQSRFPDEIVIVDGGSTDNTISEISNFQFPPSRDKAKIKLIFKKGNRSVGRNEAIKSASNEIVACSDAGCVLDKDWVKNIVKPFEDAKIDVVAGYYDGKAVTIFEKCLIPYVLVMPDQVNANEFLPATRSMAFRRSIWKKIKGFPEEFSNNEDYVFAKRLKKNNANIILEKKAIAHWIPRSNIEDAFVMFYRFAKGDAQSRMFRPKVSLIFLRYIIFIFTLLTAYAFRLSYMFIILRMMISVYVLWSIIKNYKYVKDIRAICLLPLLQITSDVAIILGTISGIISSYKLQPSERHQR
jgi:glycosyltransferase involved in cell wall biosynthesis